MLVEKYLFTNSLMDTTIQDGSKRERSNDYMLYWSFMIKDTVYIPYIYWPI